MIVPAAVAVPRTSSAEGAASVTAKPSSASTSVSPATPTTMVFDVSPAPKVSIPAGRSPPAKSAAEAAAAPAPLTDHLTVWLDSAACASVTVKVNAVVPLWASNRAASAAAIETVLPIASPKLPVRGAGMPLPVEPTTMAPPDRSRPVTCRSVALSPAFTVYLKRSVLVPPPPAKVATAPSSSRRVGAPVTVTASLSVSVKVTTWPVVTMVLPLSDAAVNRIGIGPSLSGSPFEASMVEASVPCTAVSIATMSSTSAAPEPLAASRASSNWLLVAMVADRKLVMVLASTLSAPATDATSCSPAILSDRFSVPFLAIMSTMAAKAACCADDRSAPRPANAEPIRITVSIAFDIST